MDSNIYVYINGAKTSLLSLASASGISYATILARYKAGVAPESLTAGAKAVLDTVPTDGSANGITSGAVFTAVQSLASDISGLDTDKIDKVSGATAGHSAIMTAAGGVADAGYMPYRQVLLWSNASPTSAFAAQTISLDLSGYTHVVVVGEHASGATLIAPATMVPIGQTGFILSIGNLYRTFTVSATGVAFAAGVGDAATASIAIPLYIFGVKGVQ